MLITSERLRVKVNLELIKYKNNTSFVSQAF